MIAVTQTVPTLPHLDYPWRAVGHRNMLYRNEPYARRDYPYHAKQITYRDDPSEVIDHLCVPHRCFPCRTRPGQASPILLESLTSLQCRTGHYSSRAAPAQSTTRFTLPSRDLVKTIGRLTLHFRTDLEPFRAAPGQATTFAIREINGLLGRRSLMLSILPEL